MQRELKQIGLMGDKLSLRMFQKPDEVIEDVAGRKDYWSVLQSKRNAPEVVTIATISFDDVAITKHLTQYDKIVYEAISSLYCEKDFITLIEIARVMAGGQPNDRSIRPTKSQLKQIEDSILKMMTALVDIDLTDEIKNHYITIDNDRLSDYHIISNMLSAKIEKGTTRNGKEIAGFKLLDEPIIFTYNKLKKHVRYFPIEALKIGGIAEEKIIMRNYLLLEIKQIKAGKRNNMIKFSTLYSKTGILSPEQKADKCVFKNYNSKSSYIRGLRSADKRTIASMLDIWKEQGFIKHYSITRDYISINKSESKRVTDWE